MFIQKQKSFADTFNNNLVNQIVKLRIYYYLVSIGKDNLARKVLTKASNISSFTSTLALA